MNVEALTNMLADYRKAVTAMGEKTGAGLAEHAARLNDIEQKLVAAARGGGGNYTPQTWGAQFAQAEGLKAFVTAGGKGRFRMQVKAELTGAGSGIVQPQRNTDIVIPALRTFTVRELLTPGRTNSNAIEFIKETGFNNQARPVTEGALKPESELTFELETTNVKTIAHWIKASRAEILSDLTVLSSYIDGRMRYGLQYVEELQLLKGDGTGANVHGLIPQATPYNPSSSPSMLQPIDEIRLAMGQSEIAELPATGIVLNPVDWMNMQLLKNEQGDYIGNGPFRSGPRTLWDLPVATTNAIDAGDFLVGSFGLAAQIHDREDPMVEVSTEDSDNFRRNMVTILAEQRLALAVTRPEALIYGTFTAQT